MDFIVIRNMGIVEKRGLGVKQVVRKYLTFTCYRFINKTCYKKQYTNYQEYKWSGNCIRSGVPDCVND